ncbi:MAG: peptidoglycan-associated lipoprotein [Proteobacteria bacterium]|jgi:peptidoglycan-associated lipoprotein|nr:peptidoglycan-associated lipoprotein [Pseudomonadota bacterium]
MRSLPLILVLATVVLLAGCPKKPTTAPEGESGSAVPGQTEGAATEGAAGAGVGEARPLPGAEGAGGEAATAADRIVYFDYDSSEIRPEYAGLVAAQARRLAASPGLRVRLEGHTDERGSREYNVALGERRAQAVRRALLLQGVAEGQVVTVSYGEERPAIEGPDEAAYSKNRRVEIVDAG